MFKIAVLYIGTGKYLQFFKDFYTSSEGYFLRNCAKQYFVFTDCVESNDLCHSNVTPIFQAQLKWPHITLKRYHFFLAHKELLASFDYIFFVNGNGLFVQDISTEILPQAHDNFLVGAVANPMIFSRDPNLWTYDRNPKSKAYIPNGNGEFYYRGGFNGGRSSEFLKMAQTIKDWVDEDEENGVCAEWHDESHINRYFLHNRPKVLDPGYCFAEEWLEQKLITPVLIMRSKHRFGGIEFLRDQEVKKNFFQSILSKFKESNG